MSNLIHAISVNSETNDLTHNLVLSDKYYNMIVQAINHHSRLTASSLTDSALAAVVGQDLEANKMQEHEIEEGIDFIYHFAFVPADVRMVLEFIEGGQTYESCAALVAQINEFGWTADFGLDAQIHSLQPVNYSEYIRLSLAVKCHHDNLEKCAVPAALVASQEAVEEFLQDDEPTAPTTTTPSNLYVLVDGSEVVTIIRKHYNTWECDHNEEHQVELCSRLHKLINSNCFNVASVGFAISRVSMGTEFDEYCMGLLELTDLTDFEAMHSSVNCLAAHYLANEIAHYLLNSYEFFLLDTKVGSIENTKFAIVD